jgi:hypothetical protein
LLTAPRNVLFPCLALDGMQAYFEAILDVHAGSKETATAVVPLTAIGSPNGELPEVNVEMRNTN